MSAALLGKIEKADRRISPDLVARVDAALTAEGALLELFRELVLVDPQAVTEISLAAESASDVLQRMTRKIRYADHVMDAGSELNKLVAYGNCAQGLSSSLPEVARKELRRAIGEAFQLAGWIRFDHGDIFSARRLFASATRAARDADALDLLAYIAGPNSAFMATFCGDAATGVQGSYTALGWARRSGNRRLTAFTMAIAARAHARLGEARQALEVLDSAAEELDRHDPSNDDPEWLSVFDRSALDGHRGSCLLDIGRCDDALKWLREQDAAGDQRFLRNRVIWRLDSARALLAMGEVEGGCAAIVDAFEAVRSKPVPPRVLSMFSSVAGVLTQWKNYPMAAQTSELVEQIIGACD